MTREEMDVMWSRALHESVVQGEQFTRYRFAEMVAATEREACAKVCDEQVMGDLNREDMEAKRCAAAIRARGQA